MQVKGGYSQYYARANWLPKTGYSISMNVELCIGQTNWGIWVLNHELAHLYEAWACNQWTHGKKFREILELIERRND